MWAYVHMDAECSHQASQYNACAVSHTCHTHGELSMYLGNLYEEEQGGKESALQWMCSRPDAA